MYGRKAWLELQQTCTMRGNPPRDVGLARLMLVGPPGYEDLTSKHLQVHQINDHMFMIFFFEIF